MRRCRLAGGAGASLARVYIDRAAPLGRRSEHILDLCVRGFALTWLNQGFWAIPAASSGRRCENSQTMQ